MSEKSGRMKIYRWNQGNPAGRRLFDRLLEKAGNEEWDDEYLLLLIEYQKLYPASEKFEVFYAKYALAQGNAALALAIAQDGERKRRVSPVLWELLAECYERLGMRCESALYRAYLRVHCRRPLRVSVSAGEEQRYLDLFTCAARMGPYAPYISRARFVCGRIEWKQGVYAGECIPHVLPEAYPYWVGAYLERGELNSHGWLLARSREDSEFADHYGADFTFDIWRSTVQTSLEVPCAPGETYLLPVAGTEPS